MTQEDDGETASADGWSMKYVCRTPIAGYCRVLIYELQWVQ